MYIVTLENNGVITTIHDYNERLTSGTVVKGINTIDSFTFTLNPENAGFNRVHEFTTIVRVFNTNKNRYEFHGRVLYSSTSMDDSGLITKDVTCENFLGFFCDSATRYSGEQNWTVEGLLRTLINVHNGYVEEYKRFQLGEVTVEDPNDNLYCGIQVESTWDALKHKLLDVLGGEFRLRVVDGVNYLDYLTEIGEEKTTAIELSRNMKSIVRERDPSSYVTRLVPLGCKLKSTDTNGNEAESEERLGISSVNAGKNYIDDELGIEAYGIHVGVVEWDDVTEAANLLRKGQQWLTENNKLLVKYSATALDLSLLGLDIDDFDVGNSHPLKNSLLGIDDVARIIKRQIDVCEEVKSTIEFGENFKTLSDLQLEQYNKLGEAAAAVEMIRADYATNTRLTNETARLGSLIEQTSTDIVLQVSREYVAQTTFNTYREETAAELSLRIAKDDNDQIVSMLNASAEVISINSNRLSIKSDYFELTPEGRMTCVNGNFTGTLNAREGIIGTQDFSWTIGASGSNASLYCKIETIDAIGLGAETNATYFGTNGLMYKYCDRNTGELDPNRDYTTIVKAGLLAVYGDAYAKGENNSIAYMTNRGMYFAQIGAKKGGVFDGYGCQSWMEFVEKNQMYITMSGTWYTSNAITVVSDRTKKHDIEEVDDRYGVLFDNLTVKRFRYNDGKSGRYHTGFIAQEVEDAMITAGVSSEEFAALCYNYDENGDKIDYGIRYEELVALNTREIQLLKARVAELEQQLKGA